MAPALKAFRNAVVPHLDNKMSVNFSSWGGIANKCPIKRISVKEVVPNISETSGNIRL
jgi:hypothetical protein